ncbi:hypothetical protein EDB92DRAFT_1177807 [Lactarius akahatsu]|uniref:Uncharacterized protein n=1 Tax=Lactarius akahatsu TaxID=416441 RepID=A0AAD4QGV9_9AGAM|nr:hypothetical protein EDB92DRAFT_1177807 [Lactarius akahatsu]
MARIYPQGQWTVRITSVVRDARPGARNLSDGLSCPSWTGHRWTGTIVRYHMFACSTLAVFVLASLTDKGVPKPTGIWSSTTSYRSSSFSCAIHLSYWVLFGERWPDHFLGPNTCNWNDRIWRYSAVSKSFATTIRILQRSLRWPRRPVPFKSRRRANHLELKTSTFTIFIVAGLMARLYCL